MCERCPSCEREFKSVLDYPLVEVEGVKIADVSHAEIEVMFNRNVTRVHPEQIIAAVESDVVGNYLQSLVDMQGKILKPSQLSPQFEDDPITKSSGMFIVPGHPRISLGFRQGEDQPVEVRIGVSSLSSPYFPKIPKLRGITIAELKLNGKLINAEVTRA
jgi:hypothetical protein